ncbi:hypothetical protein NDU88_002629 [Pleurodeles waltl]|uniref:Uncharacterized protein n=1 Tax=Pleurodeles waltl TaxID=8319 RepID=A0AAV7NEJ6_PLEWA|nr:hypothetical protein NDU88_002629 [Pleurodeles waltl]
MPSGGDGARKRAARHCSGAQNQPDGEMRPECDHAQDGRHDLNRGGKRARTPPSTEVGGRDTKEVRREPGALRTTQVSGDSERWPWIWRGQQAQLRPVKKAAGAPAPSPCVGVAGMRRGSGERRELLPMVEASAPHSPGTNEEPRGVGSGAPPHCISKKAAHPGLKSSNHGPETSSRLCLTRMGAQGVQGRKEPSHDR